MTEVSTIIGNDNGRQHLGALLASLTRQARPAAEVILIDNVTRDGSADFLHAGSLLVVEPGV